MSFLNKITAASSVAADKLLKSLKANGIRAIDVELQDYDSSQATYKVFFIKEMQKEMVEKFTTFMKEQGFSVEDAGMADHMITNPGYHRKYRKFIVKKVKNT